MLEFQEDYAEFVDKCENLLKEIDNQVSDLREIRWTLKKLAENQVLVAKHMARFAGVEDVY